MVEGKSLEGERLSPLWGKTNREKCPLRGEAFFPYWFSQDFFPQGLFPYRSRLSGELGLGSSYAIVDLRAAEFELLEPCCVGGIDPGDTPRSAPHLRSPANPLKWSRS